MKIIKNIFDLRDVSISFEKHAIKRKSLREALGAKLCKLESDKIEALRNINLQIKNGEHLGIVGRNGAGKSTLLKVLTKVIIPNSGKVWRDSTKHYVPMLEVGIGFQADLSGRENCYLAGILMGYTKSEIDEKIDSIIEFAGLSEFIGEPVKNYSSGMYARLAFAISTDIDPEVLIIDEVFGVGDEFFMRKCIERMQKMMANGTTTIFVAHNIDFLVAQCNRMIWLENGEILMDGDPQVIAQAYRSSDTNLRLLKAQ